MYTAGETTKQPIDCMGRYVIPIFCYDLPTDLLLSSVLPFSHLKHIFRYRKHVHKLLSMLRKNFLRCVRSNLLLYDMYCIHDLLKESFSVAVKKNVLIVAAKKCV